MYTFSMINLIKAVINWVHSTDYYVNISKVHTPIVAEN